MTRNIAAIALLLSAFLPQASARYCYYDRYGYRRCSGLSPGARAGIGIAIGGAFLVLLLLAAWIRRRRVQRANKAFIVQGGQQPYQPGFQSNQPVSQPYGGYMNQKSGAPQTQYPAAAHTPTGRSTGPGMYTPPPGPPPPGGNPYNQAYSQPPGYPDQPRKNSQFGQANV
ncbi:hypothetical protein FRC00_007527 [Tulasnella sp. 408]|nr:hypothetical protein FRC00_007527 [Tulasnella sp. 408]